MILGFKPEFVPKILDGTKIHTIREDKKDRWKPGNKIHFATGIRTPEYKQFKEWRCISTQPILIMPALFTAIHIYPSKHSRRPTILRSKKSLDEFAVADGFECIEDFFGKLIHWTSKRY